MFPKAERVALYVTEYTECQAFSPVVRIGSHPRLLNRKRVLPPPWFGGGGHTRLRESGRRVGANSGEGTDTLVL
jgi:hypothetical protein